MICVFSYFDSRNLSTYLLSVAYPTILYLPININLLLLPILLNFMEQVTNKL